jgi:hypothetical protein
MRHLEFLKGVQYKPPDSNGLKTGILMGEKKFLQPILRFLLLEMDQVGFEPGDPGAKVNTSRVYLGFVVHF